MSTKKPALGRGISHLLGDLKIDQQQLSNAISTDRLQTLSVDLLERGVYQPRREIQPEALAELADSIRAQGVIQPIVVRKLLNGRYEVIAGERRWRAAVLAGLSQIPAIIREVSDQTAMAVALIENIQRENLNPMEEAYALNRLIEEFHLTHEQAGQTVGRSRTSVTNQLRLLQLHPQVRTMVEQGLLDMGHARALLSLPQPQQAEVAQQVHQRQMSVRETEEYVKQQLTPKIKNLKSQKSASAQDPDLIRLQQHLSDHLGATVEIQHQPDGNGVLMIRYHQLDQLDGIIEKIVKSTEDDHRIS